MACNWLMMTSSGDNNGRVGVWVCSLTKLKKIPKIPKAEQETAQPTAARFNKSFVLIYDQTYFFREVNRSIALQSPYMQNRVKLSVLNENAAKHLHLHLDPSQSPSRHMGSTARKITQ